MYTFRAHFVSEVTRLRRVLASRLRTLFAPDFGAKTSPTVDRLPVSYKKATPEAMKIWEILSETHGEERERRERENCRRATLLSFPFRKKMKRRLSVYFDSSLRRVVPSSWWILTSSMRRADQPQQAVKWSFEFLSEASGFKIHPINFMSLSAIKLDQRMLSSDPSAANIKRWDLRFYCA